MLGLEKLEHQKDEEIRQLKEELETRPTSDEYQIALEEIQELKDKVLFISLEPKSDCN